MTIGLASTYSVNEASMTVQVCARILDGALRRDAVVTLSTSDGTATGLLQDRSIHSTMIQLHLAPDDYTAVNVLLVFSETSTKKCVNISINADRLHEAPEMFSVNLTTDDSSVILDPQSAPVNIIDSNSMCVHVLDNVVIISLCVYFP